MTREIVLAGSPSDRMTEPNSSPTIRRAAAVDVPTVRAIARAAYAKYVSRIGREPAPMRADYAAEIAAARVVLVVLDGKTCGYLVAWPEVDAYFIDNIAIDPTEQKKGLGRRLIEYATVQAKALNLPALRLYTNEQMTENLAMYVRMGFVETHRAVENGYRRVFLRRDVAIAR